MLICFRPHYPLHSASMCLISASAGVGHDLSANGPSANGAASQQRSSTSPAGTAQNGVAPSKNSASGAGAGDSPEKEKEKEKDGEGQAETVAPTPTGEEVDFKKISIAEALRVLKVGLLETAVHSVCPSSPAAKAPAARAGQQCDVGHV